MECAPKQVSTVAERWWLLAHVLKLSYSTSPCGFMFTKSMDISSAPLAKMVPAPTDTTWKCDFRNTESPLKRWIDHLKPQSGLWKHIMSWWDRNNKKNRSGLLQGDETLERPPRRWWFAPSPPLRARDRRRSPGRCCPRSFQEGKGLLCIAVQIWEMFASQLFTWYL